MKTTQTGTAWRLRLLVLGAALLAWPAAGSAQKKPDFAPVTVDATDPPADMKPGDQVETTLRFTALDDLQRLEVSVAPFMGVELLSATRDAAFTGVPEGETRELKVTVRLLDTSGSLAVTYRVVTADRKSAGATTIEYGHPGN